MAIEDRLALFIDQYMIDQNGTQAMLRVDPSMSVQSASKAAYRALCRYDVRGEVDRRIAEQRSRNKLTVEMIEGMIRDLAEVEPLDIWNEQGDVRPLHEMPVNARRAIKAIKKTTKEHAITGIVEEVVLIELWDKKGCLEMLGKHKKMFTDKLEVEGEIKQKVRFIVDGIEK